MEKTQKSNQDKKTEPRESFMFRIGGIGGVLLLGATIAATALFASSRKSKKPNSKTKTTKHHPRNPSHEHKDDSLGYELVPNLQNSSPSATSHVCDEQMLIIHSSWLASGDKETKFNPKIGVREELQVPNEIHREIKLENSEEKDLSIDVCYSITSDEGSNQKEEIPSTKFFTNENEEEKELELTNQKQQEEEDHSIQSLNKLIEGETKEEGEEDIEREDHTSSTETNNYSNKGKQVHRDDYKNDNNDDEVDNNEEGNDDVSYGTEESSMQSIPDAILPVNAKDTLSATEMRQQVKKSRNAIEKEADMSEQDQEATQELNYKHDQVKVAEIGNEGLPQLYQHSRVFKMLTAIVVGLCLVLLLTSLIASLYHLFQSYPSNDLIHYY